MKSKICGISDSKILKYLTGHSSSPQYIGFIINYPKSKRFIEHSKLKKLLKVNKKFHNTFAPDFIFFNDKIIGRIFDIEN